MRSRIPDLWRMKEDAHRLYQLYLSRLQSIGCHERVVAACRQIRRYAARGPGMKEALFTFSIEIEALCDLRRYQAAWRAERRREEIVCRKRLDLRRRKWSAKDVWVLRYDFWQLLYFLGRYRVGCAMLESALRYSLRKTPGRSYDLFYYVFNDEVNPTHRCRVTLKHFYDRLGRGLHEWNDWNAFVDGFHPRLFQLAKVGRERLRADPSLLEAFERSLRTLQKQRTISRITRGQQDLVERPARVRKWQKATAAARKKFEQAIQPTRAEFEATLLKLFPELRDATQRA
ncbi:MAG: hypothetical protein HYS13_01490 [Planctomycetia bacterium]|nr:hypothetical protein [Planctomycetia bacterium]